LYSIILVIKARRMRWAGHVARMAEMSSAYKILVEPEGKRSLEMPRCSWKDNIKVDVK